jgi:general secretion pathway protein L
MTNSRASQPIVALWQLPARLLRDGFVWWLSELSGLLPSLSVLTGGRGEPSVLLDMTRGDATLSILARGRIVATLPLVAGAPDPAARVKALVGSHRLGDAATVRLDPALVLLTSVALPQAASASLRPILEHQLERLAPMAPGDVCFDYRVARASAGSLDVSVAIVKRTTLDRAIELARSAGLTLRAITAAPPAGRPDGLQPFVFWRAGRAGHEAPARRRLKRLLELAALGLVVLAYGVYVARLDGLRDDLRRQVAAVEQDARRTQEVGRAAAATVEALAFFESRRRDPTPLQVLDTLTRLVPEDAWASEFALRGKTGELTGVSPHAADLIARFEASPTFEKPEFRSPIMLSPDGKGERFVLTFSIRPAPP